MTSDNTLRTSGMRVVLIFSFFLMISGLCQVVQGQENNSDTKSDSTAYSWERFSIKAGGFIAGLNSDIQFGNKQSGLGISVNLEDALNLKSSSLVLRGELGYTFGKRMHSNLEFGYFALFRNSTKVLESEITVGDQSFPIGTEVNSRYNLQIFKATYDYTFYSDKRVKLGVSAGLFVMPISFSTSALRLSEESIEVVAPLPVLGVSSSFAITPKLYFIQSIEIFYLATSPIKGVISDINLRVEYNIWEHFGLGIGFNSYGLSIEAKEKNAFLNFKGTIKTSYSGLLFYGKYYF